MALFIFVLVTARMGFPSEEIMFASTDANSYLKVGNWIFEGIETDYTTIRPVLYPFVLKLLMIIGNVWAVWIFQSVLWLISLNLIYLSIQRVTRNNKAAFTGGLIYAINLSVISLTHHGLTEVFTIFLISAFTYLVSKNYRDNIAALFHGMLLILVLLAIVKPAFLYLVILCIVVMLPVYMIKEYKRRPSQLLIPAIILVPLIIQIGIMKSRHDTYNAAEIGSNTFKYYLFAQTYSVINEIDIEDARKEVTPLTKEEMQVYALNNFGAFVQRYWKNVQENINSSSVYLFFPNDHPVMKVIMSNSNNVYHWLHWLFFIPFILVGLRYAVQDRKRLLLILCLAVPFYFIIFSSGISYSQGDRLVIISLPLWIVLYAQIFMQIATMNKGQRINLLKLKFHK